MYIDAHGHWTDLRVTDDQREVWFKSSTENHISLFMEAGVDPAGWLRQIEFKKKYPANFKLAFGLHPYFVAKSDNTTCEQAMDDLSKIIHLACGLGETGLDFREQYLNGADLPQGAEDRQIVFFENQIQLAKACRKPLVLHIVHAHNEAQKILSIWDADDVGGMVHAFNGSYEIAETYLNLGFLISVGGAVTFEKNKKLIDAVKKIPLEKLLIESDCPDQAPSGWLEPQNSPLSVLNVAQTVAEIKDINQKQVLEKTTENFKTLFR